MPEPYVLTLIDANKSTADNALTKANNSVQLTEDQFVDGTKTFNNTVFGTVTKAVYADTKDTSDNSIAIATTEFVQKKLEDLDLNDIKIDHFVDTTENQIIQGEKTFMDPIVGNLTGVADKAVLADTLSNTDSSQSIATTEFVHNVLSDYDILDMTADDVVKIEGNQVVNGIKKFEEPIIGNLTGTATIATTAINAISALTKDPTDKSTAVATTEFVHNCLSLIVAGGLPAIPTPGTPTEVGEKCVQLVYLATADISAGAIINLPTTEYDPVTDIIFVNYEGFTLIPQVQYELLAVPQLKINVDIEKDAHLHIVIMHPLIDNTINQTHYLVPNDINAGDIVATPLINYDKDKDIIIINQAGFTLIPDVQFSVKEAPNIQFNLNIPANSYLHFIIIKSKE